jgi:hypothetical protein
VSEADLEKYLVEFKNKVERSSLPEKPEAIDKFDAFVVKLRRFIDSRR